MTSWHSLSVLKKYDFIEYRSSFLARSHERIHARKKISQENRWLSKDIRGQYSFDYSSRNRNFFVYIGYAWRIDDEGKCFVYVMDCTIRKCYLDCCLLIGPRNLSRHCILIWFSLSECRENESLMMSLDSVQNTIIVRMYILDVNISKR